VRSEARFGTGTKWIGLLAVRAVEAVRWHALRLFAPCFQADFVARLTGERRLERERPEKKLRLVQAAAQPVG